METESVLTSEWKERLRSLPEGPGIYIFKDSQGRPLYIGKALSLRRRVASYFHDHPYLSPRLRSMISQAQEVDFILTGSELEAFILESNLIKEQRPRYNIVLRDDKHYPFLRLDPREPFARLSVVRRIKDDGALYFGPYVPASAMWDTLALVNKVLPLRKCKTLRASTRPCLEHHLGRCLAPCTGQVKSEEYAELILQARLLLEGKRKDLLPRLRKQMKEASSRLDFEKAARLRDQIASLERALEEQRAISAGQEDLDAFGLAFQGDWACIQSFAVRKGRLLDKQSFLFHGLEEERDREVLLASFLPQFYSRRMSLPTRILLPFTPPDASLLLDWLRQKRGGTVHLEVPSRGKKLRLLQLAMDNARQFLLSSLSPQTAEEEEIRELKKILPSSGELRRIEAYDISNLLGNLAVGSMVVWEAGQWRKESYRRFKIKTVSGADDFAMMRELIRRRLQHQGELPLSDLILIDGGKGQLNAGLAALREEGAVPPIVLALSKEEEEIWLPGRRNPVRLPSDSPALHLLQRIRDEAHRFALAYHRLLRKKDTLRSPLDGIPGIGRQRKKALLQRFGNLTRIREASLADLQAVPGISPRLAKIIQESL